MKIQGLNEGKWNSKFLKSTLEVVNYCLVVCSDFDLRRLAGSYIIERTDRQNTIQIKSNQINPPTYGRLGRERKVS